MKRPRGTILAPVLCLALLGAIEVEHRTQLVPKDAEPYHGRAAAAIRAVPREVTNDASPWSALQVKEPEAAVKLLGNAEALCLHFTGRIMKQDCSADLLVVHCADSRDMTGHYPPVCYPANGHTQTFRSDNGHLKAGGLDVPYMEYAFEKESRGRAYRICVYNFFVVPGKGVVRDIQDLRDAAEDYQRRFFGATQVQLVVSAELPPSWRERILQSMIEANGPLLRTLNSAEVPLQ
jgi:hypothetical protein